LKIEERKVAVRDLMVGMYVCRLDREWNGTPFPLQGLPIASPADIAALAEHCEYVYVDIELGLAPLEKNEGGSRAPAPAPRDIEGLRNSVAYRNTATFDDELPLAREAQSRVAEFASRVLEDVRHGRPILPDDVRNAVQPMVSSILRNTDAFMWIESLRKRDAYDYTHALNCSALAAAFGRHIGLPEDLLTDLATGGLLLDIGKLRIPAELFAREGPLDRDETAAVRKHVELGLAALQQTDTVPPHVYEMIRTHHERDNGSGYPDRLPGGRIPLFGRMAAVIDSYDAMTSNRGYRKAMSRHAALQELYRARDSLYSAEVVEQFIQCLNVYPTGSLVELDNGCVALVMAQNPARRLRPRVMVLTTPDKQLAADFRPLDLMDDNGDQGTPQVLIANALEPGAYGLDPAELYL
jgi:cyclic di-GMP phosphodiesterase